jgi:hypothetical protein
MDCPFCEWGLWAGTLDPCEILIEFDDHLSEHMAEMIDLSGP